VGIPPQLLDELQRLFLDRRISEGFAAIEEARPLWSTSRPDSPGSGELTGWLALWVDLGFGDSGLVASSLDRFSLPARAALPVAEYAHLRIAEALIHMNAEQWDTAIEHLDFVVTVGAQIQDLTMSAVGNYWKARALRQKGDYGEAQEHARRGQQAAEALGASRFVAVIQVLESWLLFQRGRTRESWELLDRAAGALAGTNDHVVLGNIQSAYGRMLRRQGRYEPAIQAFELSLFEYRNISEHHRNVARSLANMAYVKRLLALQWRRKIDADVAGRRGTSTEDRERFTLYRGEALDHLRAAGGIYIRLGQHHGAGTVRVNSGLLYLDGGELEPAAAEAHSAYVLGLEKDDRILMARARILQCLVENARVEEQVVDASPHAALDYARDGVELAESTDNQRLKARALLAQARTLAGEFFEDRAGARELVDKAGNLLQPDAHDPLWQDLQELRASTMRAAATLDSRLRAWSEGEIGDKTLQQLSEEFESFMILKVWEQEEKRVIRVARKLRVSPKKVRRVLREVGKLG